jgi:hypothetical protein
MSILDYALFAAGGVAVGLWFAPWAHKRGWPTPLIWAVAFAVGGAVAVHGVVS